MIRHSIIAPEIADTSLLPDTRHADGQAYALSVIPKLSRGSSIRSLHTSVHAQPLQHHCLIPFLLDSTLQHPQNHAAVRTRNILHPALRNSPFNAQLP